MIDPALVIIIIGCRRGSLSGPNHQSRSSTVVRLRDWRTRAPGRAKTRPGPDSASDSEARDYASRDTT
eukprot:1613751-Rhodomonas_salina.1